MRRWRFAIEEASANVIDDGAASLVAVVLLAAIYVAGTVVVARELSDVYASANAEARRGAGIVVLTPDEGYESSVSYAECEALGAIGAVTAGARWDGETVQLGGEPRDRSAIVVSPGAVQALQPTPPVSAADPVIVPPSVADVLGLQDNGRTRLVTGGQLTHYTRVHVRQLHASDLSSLEVGVLVVGLRQRPPDSCLLRTPVAASLEVSQYAVARLSHTEPWTAQLLVTTEEKPPSVMLFESRRSRTIGAVAGAVVGGFWLLRCGLRRRHLALYRSLGIGLAETAILTSLEFVMFSLLAVVLAAPTGVSLIAIGPQSGSVGAFALLTLVQTMSVSVALALVVSFVLTPRYAMSALKEI